MSEIMQEIVTLAAHDTPVCGAYTRQQPRLDCVKPFSHNSALSESKSI